MVVGCLLLLSLSSPLRPLRSRGSVRSADSATAHCECSGNRFCSLLRDGQGDGHVTRHRAVELYSLGLAAQAPSSPAVSRRGDELRAAATAGSFDTRIAIYGTGVLADRLISALSDPALHCRFTGAYDDRIDAARHAPGTPGCLGSIEELIAAAARDRSTRSSSRCRSQPIAAPPISRAVSSSYLSACTSAHILASDLRRCRTGARRIASRADRPHRRQDQAAQ